MTTDLTPCQEHVQMLRTSGLFTAGARSLWDTDTDHPDAAQRQAIADAKAGCLDCHAFDACRAALDARMAAGEHVVGIVAGTDRTERKQLKTARTRALGVEHRRAAAIARMRHGEVAGYRAHYRLGVLPVCDACRGANADYLRGLKETAS